MLAQFPAFSKHTVQNPILFDYGHPSRSLRQSLLKKYPLRVVAGQSSEIHQMRRLARWLYMALPAKGDALEMPLHTYSAESLLEAARSGVVLNCSGCATILKDIYLALGWHARVVACLPADPEDWECHVVTEVFARSIGKWVVMDPSSWHALMEKHEYIDLRQLRSALMTGTWTKSLLEQAYLSKNMFMFMCYNGRIDGDHKDGFVDCLLSPREYDKTLRQSKRYGSSYITTSSSEFWQVPQ